MNSKKSNQANIDKKRSAYFQVGLVCALALVLIGLEWTVFTKESKSEARVEMKEELMIIPPNVIIEEPKPQPRPKQEKSDDIIIEDDDTEDTEEEEKELIDESDKETIAIDTSEIKVIIGEGTLKPPPVEVLTIADVMPEFPGGMEKMNPWLRKQLRYPKQAKLANRKGKKDKIYIKFIVEKDGTISSVKCMKGKDNKLAGLGFEAEAMRVVKKMPRWKPGEHMGHKVRVERILPVTFTIY